jgi:NADH-quinone oxidoreductase subunit F/NADP-reducing hydrogenase subunit HndC
MSPEETIQEMLESGLRGRGGAGFPTGLKWRFIRNAEGDEKYMICNADEGDPGAFANRRVLEGDPHSVIEGMIIGAYAAGSNKGYIYCRAEYPIAVRTMKTAIEQARNFGLLGDDILGSGFSFDLEVRMGAGAFVCGEETALMASIEGQRGEPRPRPPFPAQKGLWEEPSNINNVETYANVPQIILNGADWFADLGYKKSTGTKTFSMAGDVINTGLIEVPFGITLREIIFDVGGGIKDDKKFKAVQTGGPMGGCLPEAFLGLPMDYEALAEAGSILGSGGLVVMDEDTCMVDIARFFMEFTQDESCGKCTPCRVGTRRILEILTGICEGKGKPEDIDTLRNLCDQINENSLCGLGKGAPNPVKSTLEHFLDEYEAHIYEKRCPSKVCKSLIRFEIIDGPCTGCTLCARNCPVDAISGERRQTHVIDPDICIKCGICEQICPYDAIEIK